MFKMKQLINRTFFAAVIMLSGLPALHAQEAAKEDKSIPCLKLDRIRDVDVIDNKTIVFQTGNNDYYLNRLPYNCNGLRLNDGFLYRTSLNEICNVDVITVLDKIGPGYTGGPSCGLGRFEPITKEEIKALKDSLKKK